jgi:UDP-N-acetylglucosamine pyrophosphorylase
MFFPQGVLPSLDMDRSRCCSVRASEVATNPDGHGGSMKALVVSGAIADMKSLGVSHISYFQVDNPNVRVLDPVFLGCTPPNKESSSGDVEQDGDEGRTPRKGRRLLQGTMARSR